MNFNPLVTIGIPTCNRVKGLQHTIECALAQNYENIEILIADNCTEPETEINTLIKSYSTNPKIRYYRHDQNRGATYNFEFILRNANGEFCIWFCDDDDYNDPDLISNYVSALMSSPNSVLAIGDVEYVDGIGKIFIKDEPPYGLQGSLFKRLTRYLTTDITDNLMYGMFRTSYMRNFKFERNVSTPEKFLILYLLSLGSVVDVPNVSYRNIYSFKTSVENVDNQLMKNHFLVWYKKSYEYLPLGYAVYFSLLYTFIHIPKLSWPVRKLFGYPKKHSARKYFCEPVRTKLNHD
ncbi:glycosyltransferase family 2 protein [Spirulina subsalsa]|uniref:glycosyltransferase family 2 protein n=1 Tax=Spirulina subsalsa TaxID=54311 RepID=UPI0002DDD4F9|nr:glycosyltransferase family 2 protein [Spirulina subsalsa]